MRTTPRGSDKGRSVTHSSLSGLSAADVASTSAQCAGPKGPPGRAPRGGGRVRSSLIRPNVDCDGDRSVSIGALITAVNISRGRADIATYSNIDGAADGLPSIAEADLALTEEP